MNNETIKQIERLRNNELTDEEIQELEKTIKRENREIGKQVNVKINKNARDFYPVHLSELENLVDVPDQKYVIYKINKELLNNKELKDEDIQKFEGTKLCCSDPNFDEKQIKFWLEEYEDEYFVIDFENKKQKKTKDIENGDYFFHLLKEQESPTIDIEKRAPKTENLKENNDFQTFLSRIKRYDDDRMKLNNMREYYDDETIQQFIDKMYECGYISKSRKFQNTGNDIEDYYYVLSKKYIHMLKFQKLKNRK